MKFLGYIRKFGEIYQNHGELTTSGVKRSGLAAAIFSAPCWPGATLILRANASPGWPGDDWTGIQVAQWAAWNSSEPPSHPQCKTALTAEIPLHASRHAVKRLLKSSLRKASLASTCSHAIKAFSSSLKAMPGI